MEIITKSLNTGFQIGLWLILGIVVVKGAIYILKPELDKLNGSVKEFRKDI